MKTLAETLDTWIRSLRRGQSVDALLADLGAGTTPPTLEMLLRRHLPQLRQGDEQLPAWRILLQIVLESHDASLVEAGLPQLDALHDVEPPLLRLSSPRRPEDTRVSFGEGEKVTCACWASASTIVTGGADRVLRVWDARSGHLSARLRGHSTAVQGVSAVARDEVVSWDTRRELRLWRIGEGATSLPPLRLNRFPIGVMGISPQRALLWTAHDIGLLTWREALIYEGFRLPIDAGMDLSNATPFALDHRRDVLATWENNVVFLGSLSDPSQVFHASIPHGVVRSVFFAGEDRLVCLTDAGEAWRWSVSLSSEVPLSLLGKLELEGIQGGVALSRGRALAWDHHGAVHIWRPLDGVLEDTFPSPSPGALVTAACLLGDDHALLLDTAAQARLLTLGPTRSRRPLGSTSGHSFIPSAVKDHAIVWAHPDAQIELWSAQGQVGDVHDDAGFEHVESCATGQLLAVSRHHLAHAWELAATALGEPHDAAQSPPSKITVTLSRDDATLWTGDDSGQLTRWDIARGLQTHQLKAHESPVIAMAQLQRGDIVSFAHQGRARVWSASNGELITESSVPLSGIRADATTLSDAIVSVTHSEDPGGDTSSTVIAWSPRDGAILSRVDIPGQRVEHVMADTERRCITFSDAQVSMWRLADGALIASCADPRRASAIHLLGEQALIAEYPLDDAVSVWTWREGDLTRRTITLESAGAHALRRVLTSPESGRFVVWTDDGLWLGARAQDDLTPIFRPDTPLLDLVLADEKLVIASMNAIACVDLREDPTTPRWIREQPRTPHRSIARFGAQRVGVGQDARVLVYSLETGALEGIWQAEDRIRPVETRCERRGLALTSRGALRVIES
jgi:WD40 repeat protein